MADRTIYVGEYIYNNGGGGGSTSVSPYTKFAINKGNPSLMYIQGSGTVEQPFSVTTMSSDGTIGGNSFAISGTYYSTYYGYQGFAPQTQGCCITGSLGSTYFEMYNPNRIKDLTVTMTNFVLGSYYYPLDQYQIKYSNDGSTWVDGETGRNTNYTGTFSISIVGGYKYIRIYPTNFYRSNSVCWKNMTISGTEVLSVSTADTLYFNVDSNNQLTYTSASGQTKTVLQLNSINVQSTPNGEYKVALPAEGHQPYLFNGTTYIQQTKPYSEYNVTGSPTIVNNVVSGFSTSNYIKLKQAFNPGSGKWRIQIPFTTGAISGTQDLYSSCVANITDPSCILIYINSSGELRFYLSSTGTSWDIANNIKCSDVAANTSYIVELLFTGTQYIAKISTDNGSTWTTGATINSTSVVNTIATSYIGVRGGTMCAFLGSINMNRAEFNLDNTLWISPQEPYSAKLFNGTTWEDYEDVLLLDSKVTVSSGTITALEQPKYNNSHLVANKQYISRLGMPSTTKWIDLTLGASGSVYIAPGNGYVFLQKLSTAVGQYTAVSNLKSNGQGWLFGNCYAPAAGYHLNSCCPAKKGDRIYIEYNAGGETTKFFFIYAEGEVD